VTGRVVIVGAGATGLACAGALAGDYQTVIVDRVPVAGGVLGWRSADTRRLAADASHATMLLGATATRWDGQRLTVIGPDRAHQLACDACVVATGARPMNRAELGIAGTRPAGVVAATVAAHLAETGLLVGRHPVIIGGGDWAARVAHGLRRAGAKRIVVVARQGAARPIDADELITGEPVVLIDGRVRVAAVETSQRRVACDAVVLAEGLVAMCNIDGALADEPPIVHAHPLRDPGSVAEACRAGRDAAAAVLAMMQRV
jgi:hypothetical protein